MSGVQRPHSGAFLAAPSPIVATGRQSTQPNSPNPLPSSASSATNVITVPQLKPIEIAAQTINQALVQESRYPDLESYVTQGISSDYDIVSSSAWAPFQMVKVHEIPDRIFEQHDAAQVSAMLGLFAELNYAWMSIDNALYLWNYTDSQPEVVGFEDQPNNITSVKLVVPRPGVFVESITHLIVIATSADIFLLGVSCADQDGRKAVSLYQTKMSTSIKGMNISVIVGSPATGRIFFGGTASNNLYELVYQQEEGWFQAKCNKICHTGALSSSLLPFFSFGTKSGDETVAQMVIDDSRKLLYTLSSKSTIRVFYLPAPTIVSLVITQTLESIQTHISHMVTQTDLLTGKVVIVTISPISANEATRTSLMAVTSTGVRIFLSVTSSYGYSGPGSDAPSSMQVVHVKFPPTNEPSRRISQSMQHPQLHHSSGHSTSQHRAGVDTDSESLIDTHIAVRFSPGYFLNVVRRPNQAVDSLFLSSPDCGLIARAANSAVVPRFLETAFRVSLKSVVEDIGVVTPSVPATSQPVGYGNELAVQYDEPVPEIAVLTNTGIHTFRRRRLVDVFAGVIRSRAAEDGLDLAVKKVVRLYGRQELAATAIGVACGQALDVSDARILTVTDPEIVEAARTVFIEHGGKAVYNENNIPDQVRPSPRHGGLALYISRLIRSVWQATVITERLHKVEGKKDKMVVESTVKVEKLRRVQQDLTKLSSFLDRNKAFIEGLAGPEALTRGTTKQEELALQGEHRAMHSLIQLIIAMVESISFVLVLFENEVGEIFISLPDDQRQQLRLLTFQALCCSEPGRQLARDLVKAIVNRDIANGASVEAVADALRRRCGSFCSPDDVLIFKAREQLKRAAESGLESEQARLLLNDSLDLFRSVVKSVDLERLKEAVVQYIDLSFFAGAIKLILEVAHHMDLAKRALGWVRDGKPEGDARQEKFEARAQCYLLVQDVISAVDSAFEQVDPRDPFYPAMTQRKNEAYAEINSSDDEVFLTTLFDWYVQNGWVGRIFALTSEHVVQYLRRNSESSTEAADILWQYFAHHGDYYSAAEVQLKLADSPSHITLANRIDYLSRAKANGSTRLTGIADLRSGRNQRQKLLRDITDRLDIALVQQDIMHRVRLQLTMDSMLISPEARERALGQLNGQILTLDQLFNEFAAPLQYHAICISIYYISSHRNSHDILKAWTDLVTELHQRAQNPDEPEAFQLISEEVRTIARRVNLDHAAFPVTSLVQMLLEYTADYGHVTPSTTQNWALDVFLQLSVPYDVLAKALESASISSTPRMTAYVAMGVYYLLRKWYDSSVSGGGMVFGGGPVVEDMAMLLRSVAQTGVLTPYLNEYEVEEFLLFQRKLDMATR